MGQLIGDPGTILPVILTVFTAALLQSTAGFGFALLAVPLLSLFMPLTTVVPLILILSTFTNISVAVQRRKALRLGDILPLLAAGIAGIPLGVWALGRMNPVGLRLAVGVLVIATAAILFFGWKIPFRSRLLSYGAAGLLSGFLNGSLSLSGPPIVLFLSNEGYDRDSFRANLTFYGILTNMAAIATFAAGKMLTPDLGKTIALSLVPLLAGTAAGIKLSGKIGEEHFKRAILLLLALMSVLSLAGVLSDLAAG